MVPTPLAQSIAPAPREAPELLQALRDVDGFTVSQLWHERMQHDAVHVWLRKMHTDASRSDAPLTEEPARRGPRTKRGR